MPKTRDIVCCDPSAKRAKQKRNRERDNAETAALCKALGHPARVQILRHLLDAGTCVFGDLSDVVPLAPSTVAQHLAQLKSADLISHWEDGQNSCYCANEKRLKGLKVLLSAL